MGTAAESSHNPGLPGSIAAGLGSANQLVALTSSVSVQVAVTTAPYPLFILPPRWVTHSDVSAVIRLRGDEYPVLAETWDNEEDDVFDRI